MAGPSARRARAWKMLLAVGLACAVALALESILLTLPSGPLVPGSTHAPESPVVAVADVDLITDYSTTNVSDTNYLHQSDCGCGPVDVPPGHAFSWWIRLGNTDPISHTFEGVQLDAPFVLAGVSPASTTVLPPGQNVTITLEIVTPSSGGVYDVTGTLTVS